MIYIIREVVADMICMKCMAVLANGSSYCSKCGKPIVSSNAAGYAKSLNVKHEWGKPTSAAPRSDSVQTDKNAGATTASPQKNEPEHLFPWLKSEFLRAFREIPKQISKLAIYAGIVLFVNLIFWTANFNRLPLWMQPLKRVVSLVVFLTATYNDIIPKTIFWVLLFTFGKKLFHTMRKKGFIASFACMKNIVPELIAVLKRTGLGAYGILGIGVGAGLFIANNFASYSRFSGARNKLDKYFVVLIIAFSISYLLGEAKKTGLFRFIKLGTKDIWALLGKAKGLSDECIYIIISGFVAGLLLDAPLIFAKWMYGGYIMGLLVTAAGIVLIFAAGKKPEVKA